MGSRPNHSADDQLILPRPLPQPPKLAKPEEPTAHKRAAPDDEVIEEPPAKRVRMNGSTPSGTQLSPSKKHKLDEDGILLLDSADGKADDIDIIEID